MRGVWPRPMRKFAVWMILMAETESGDTADDLEVAYRRALKAVNAAEQQVNATLRELSSDSDAALEPDKVREVSDVASCEDRPSGQPAADALPDTEDGPRTTPQQVIEAAIFVGGIPLTSRKLSSLFRGDFDPKFVAETIESLNRRYAHEQRPYEIRLGEGGYSMQLRAECDGLHRRVFGIGPREIRLSQDALEVLALVAYRQPISREAIEKTGKNNVGNLLRQLVRRRLLTVDRGQTGPDAVQYRTTPRFLQLFGIGDPSELPQPDMLEFK